MRKQSKAIAVEYCYLTKVSTKEVFELHVRPCLESIDNKRKKEQIQEQNSEGRLFTLNQGVSITLAIVNSTNNRLNNGTEHVFEHLPPKVRCRMRPE